MAIAKGALVTYFNRNRLTNLIASSKSPPGAILSFIHIWFGSFFALMTQSCRDHMEARVFLQK